MSITTALRAATSIAAVRSFGVRSFHSARLHFLLLRGTTAAPARSSPPPPPGFAPFSSLSHTPEADSDLIQLLDSQIKFVGDIDHSQVPFEIQDETGTKSVTLRRNYGKETVEIEVSFEEADLVDDKDADAVELPLRITISKGEGPCLEFNCSASVDELIIDDVQYVSHKGGAAATNAFRGPLFEDLDEDVQKALYKYLERRGIADSIVRFLRRYMDKKYDREYLTWLSNVKDFIEK